MLSTYKAFLKNNHLQWIDDNPSQLNNITVIVHVTVLDELPLKKAELPRPKKPVEILQKIADNGGPDIDDQRNPKEIRFFG